VKNKEGASFSSPQAMLDELVGAISFDPLAFLKMNPSDQMNTLQELTGYDDTELLERRQELYDDRRMVKKEIKKCEARIDDSEIVTAVDVSDLIEKQKEGMEAGRAYEKVQSYISSNEKSLSAVKNRISEVRRELEMLEGKRKGVEHALADAREVLDETAEPPDMLEIEDEIKKAADRNREAEKSREQERVRAELDDSKLALSEINEKMARIEEERKEMAKACPMPVEDLELGEDGLIFEGVPLEQASQSAKLQISVAIGMAMNKELKVMLVREGSLLDDNALADLKAMVEDADAQLWIERVGNDGHCSVVMVDGENTKYKE